MVVAYIERAEGLKPFQTLLKSNNISTSGVFGETLAISPDGKWLAVGSPNADTVTSDYKDIFSTSASYTKGDIVLYQGRLWRAKINLIGDGSTINLATDDWEPATILTANINGTGNGYKKQGAVTMYEWSGQNWVEKFTFISPRPNGNENFGEKIVLGVDSGNYYMAISAPGNNDTSGKVYLYKYAPITEDNSQTITFSVTVGPAQGLDTGYKYYINDQYWPDLTFEVGNTYIFDQTDLSNVYFPNPVEGTVTNRHPISLSADSLNGSLDIGGTLYTTGVTYYLDNRPVTQVQYVSGFDVATTRYVKIVVTESTAGSLNYYSLALPLNMGKRIFKKYPTIAKEWQFDQNQNYRGVYDSTGATRYETGSIVWHDNALWQSLEDQNGDGSTITTDSGQWQKLNPLHTQSSLPSNPATTDNDSTVILAEGLL
jgi:hypothetical protein